MGLFSFIKLKKSDGSPTFLGKIANVGQSINHALLPVVGGAVGTLIGQPGAGAALGSKIADAELQSSLAHGLPSVAATPSAASNIGGNIVSSITPKNGETTGSWLQRMEKGVGGAVAGFENGVSSGASKLETDLGINPTAQGYINTYLPKILLFLLLGGVGYFIYKHYKK